MNEQIKAGAYLHAGDGGYREGNREDYETFVSIRNKSLVEGRIRNIIKEADRKCSETRGVYDEILIELVIQECAEIAGCNGHVSGFALGDLIKEHFGTK